MYQQYPPQSVGYLAGDVYNPQHQEYVQMNQLPNQHYNLQQRQQAQGQQLKLQLNEQNAMMSASTQQYPVQDFTNPYPNAQNPAEQQQQQQPLRTQSQQWDGYQSQPLYSAAGNTIPSLNPAANTTTEFVSIRAATSQATTATAARTRNKEKPGRKPKLRKLSELSSETPQVPKTASSSSSSPTAVNSGKPITKDRVWDVLHAVKERNVVVKQDQGVPECTRLRLNCTWPKPGTEHKTNLRIKRMTKIQLNMPSLVESKF